MNIDICNIHAIRATNSLWGIEGGDGVLVTNYINVGVVKFGRGKFNKKKSWIDFYNKLSNYDISPIKSKLKKYVGRYYSEIRFSHNVAFIKLMKPMRVSLGQVGNTCVITDILEMEGTIDWEMIRSSSNSLNVCDTCRIYIRDIRFIR